MIFYKIGIFGQNQINYDFRNMGISTKMTIFFIIIFINKGVQQFF